MTARAWFDKRTFHHSAYADVDELLHRKGELDVRISVCVPTLNEAATIGPILDAVRMELIEGTPLVDELAIVDSSSNDGTQEIAAASGAKVLQDHEIAPQHGHLGGKGDAMWKSLFALSGDLIVWLDADVSNFHPRFVYGIVGPLLADPEISYVKGFYERPIGVGDVVDPIGGGRVTELMARPLLNAFRPDLAGLVQPLSGEYAGRREVLASVPFFTGYAVEVGLLMDIADRYGVDSIAQVDLEERHHRNRPMRELSPMSFAILRAVMDRLESRGALELKGRLGEELVLFHRDGESPTIHETEVRVHERPPAAESDGYPFGG